MGEVSGRGVYTARGPMDGEDWSTVAVVVNERMAARRIGQQELAHLSGVSVSTLRHVQHGAGRRVQNKTLTAISRALGWPDDHLSLILLGNHPTGPRATTAPGSERVSESSDALRRMETQLAEVNRRLAVIESVLLTDQQ